MKPPRIVVIGSSNTDLMVKLDRLPQPGETLLGDTLVISAGGKGGNQAVAAARAGGLVTFVARVGCDAFGEDAVSGYIREGIDVDHIQRDKSTATGAALILVGAEGENSIAVALGANSKLSIADIKKAQPAMARAAILLMQLETPLPIVLAAARIAVKAKVPVILNPAPARKLSRELLKQVTILTPNETEAEVLTGIKVDGNAAALKAAGKLLSWGVKTVVITLGKKGALLAHKGGHRFVPGFRVKAIDTTAAGDTFNGALAVALAEGRSEEEAVHFATAAAALSVTVAGAQASAPRRKDIEELLGSRGLQGPVNVS